MTKNWLSYQVLEDNGGGLHLAVFNGSECIWFSSGYQFIPGNLLVDIKALQEGANPLQDGWETYLPEDYTPQMLYDEFVAYKQGWQVIADETGIYPERMGVAGRKVFGIED